MGEPFSWSKFFGGLFDPTAYFKTLANVTRILIVVAICFGVYLLGAKLHSILLPKKPSLTSIFNVNDQQGGNVNNSADKKEIKNALINF
jgi:hypothetical protein